MAKSAKKVFDPKLFLANVGAGKAILKFRKNEHVFAQGDVADTIFYIQKGQGQAYCSVSPREGSRRRNSRARPVLRRRLLEWSKAAHRNHDGDGRLLDHGNYEARDDRRSS